MEGVLCERRRVGAGSWLLGGRLGQLSVSSVS